MVCLRAPFGFTRGNLVMWFLHTQAFAEAVSMWRYFSGDV
jgi:hypothetical protein